MSTPLAIFGPGILIAQRTDIAIPSPVNVGYAQEFSIEFAAQTKQLYGQNQFPLVAARSTIKLTGKFKAATFSALAMNAVLFGQTLSTAAGVTWNIDSTFTLSTTATSLQIGSSTTFDTDLGWKYAASNLPLQRVATGSEATGKYSVSVATPGLYAFAAGDQGANIKATYTLINTTATGNTLTVVNQLIGTTPTFQLDYYTSLNQPTAKPFAVRLFESVASKGGFQFKLEDYMIPEVDFDLFANNSGQVFNVYVPEIS